VVPGEDLQQGDQVVSIPEVLVEVRHVALSLEGWQRERQADRQTDRQTDTEKKTSHYHSKQIDPTVQISRRGQFIGTQIYL